MTRLTSSGAEIGARRREDRRGRRRRSEKELHLLLNLATLTWQEGKNIHRKERKKQKESKSRRTKKRTGK